MHLENKSGAWKTISSQYIYTLYQLPHPPLLAIWKKHNEVSTLNDQKYLRKRQS